MYDTIVIGGGPAGMMAAIIAARNKKQVILLEKNQKLGKKLYITGKGRCNLTNDSEIENHLNHLTGNKKFMYSAFYTLDPYMTLEFFNQLGLITKVERGQRVFPISDHSSDVIKAFKKGLSKENVQVFYEEVESLVVENKVVKGVKTKTGSYKCRNVIVATGGYSYQMTGSTGDGYRFAKNHGHKTITPIQGLVPIEIKDEDIRNLQGLSLKNVKLKMINKNNVTIYEELGEMLFTHFGVSGPLVLSASSYISRDTKFKDIKLSIDLKPGLSIEKLDKRIIRDFDKYSRKALKNGLIDLMPSSMIPFIIKRAGLKEQMSVYEVTKEQRHNLIKIIKNIDLSISDLRGFNEAIITRGGVDVKEINPHTMESKIVKGLYFVGEVLDLDSLTGGYNLQIAYSTAYLAGLSICEKETT